MRTLEFITFLAFVILSALVGGCRAEALESAQVPAEGLYRGSEPPSRISMPAFDLRDVITGEDISASDVRGRSSS